MGPGVRSVDGKSDSLPPPPNMAYLDSSRLNSRFVVVFVFGLEPRRGGHDGTRIYGLWLERVVAPGQDEECARGANR
jgi:hypothetical protein